ncbi:hypothetical protein SLS57_004157 [Botryosphaeria dothidea]
MSSTTMTAAEPGSNPTTAANNNPAPPTSKPTSDAPSYTSDISPPAYSEAAPANDLAAPSASTPTTTAAAASTPAPTTTAPTANDDDDDDDDDDGGGEDLPATPIPFHFLINQPPPSPSPSDAAAAPQPPRKITHIHPVPDILLSTAAPPASAQDLFVAVLQDVLGAHQDECRDAAPGACDVCGEEKESVLLTPVSFLHVDEGAPPAYGGEAVAGKRVDVLVTPVCGKAECGEVARRRVRCAMEEEGVGDGEGEERVVPAAGPEDPRCRVCGRGEGTRRCAGCGVVRYCGRECQRQDWRGGHKRVCAAWAALVEEGRAEEARQRAEEGGGA